MREAAVPTLGPRLSSLFAYPFRVFFLSAALLAALAVPAWLLMLLGGGQPPLALAPPYWHRHEMLFGFGSAAVAGFLLTAVCNWTRTDRLHGASLLALWAVWLGGRLLMLGGGALPAWLVHVVDLAFLPLVALDAGRRIWRERQSRQFILIAVLTLLWLMDVGFHVAPGGPYAHGALLMLMTLMLVIGGRITPNFSDAWLRMTGGGAAADAIRVVPALERATIGAMAVLLATVLLEEPAPLRAAVAALAAVASGARLVLWRGWTVRREPLLWVLHLAMAWIPVALALLAASALGWVAPTAWVHAAGAGAMGGLILGVMSRVALAHTGRPLRLPAGMRWAFAAVLAAAAARVLVAVDGLPWRAGLLAAAALWLAAYLLFLLRYGRMLAAPRVDGRPG
ncbi:MAG: NnrS family protein [Gammaproteobacteria bacterium]|nr:NnrS family protein [Gammaproteobacteria bacterium]